MTRHEEHHAGIVAIAPTGEGVALLDDGRRVLVGGTMRAERVRLRIAGPRRAQLLEVVEASPERVTPPCSHATRCGGCDFMHMSAEAQRRARATAVIETLAHRGIEASIDATHDVSELAYRTRARLTIKGAVGYRASRSRSLVEVDACPVLDERLEPCIGALRALMKGASGEGEAAVALGHSGRPVAEIHWKGELAPEVLGRAAQLEGFDGLCIWPEGSRQPMRFGAPAPVMIAADGEPLLVAGFAQASERGAVKLARRVADMVDGGRIVELFAGAGTLSVLLAKEGELVAVEQDGASLACLRENLRSRGLSAKLRERDANTFKIPRPTRAVVLDPPRAGAAGAMTGILAARPVTVVYVSCNVSTLARDLEVLCNGGYRLDGLELFELFPQTSHVEIVARLKR